MSKITVTAELAALLRAATAKSELYDPDGQPVGFFVPPIDLYAEPTPEQLKASAAAGGGIPHAEVMKRLGLE
jgi:hypothetical protein